MKTRRSHKNRTKNQLKITYANARGVKTKINSLKNVVNSTECDIFAITETNLKPNENIRLQGYKWISKPREDKEGGGVRILLKETLSNACTIEPFKFKFNIKRERINNYCSLISGKI